MERAVKILQRDPIEYDPYWADENKDERPKSSIPGCLGLPAPEKLRSPHFSIYGNLGGNAKDGIFGQGVAGASEGYLWCKDNCMNERRSEME